MIIALLIGATVGSLIGGLLYSMGLRQLLSGEEPAEGEEEEDEGGNAAGMFVGEHFAFNACALMSVLLSFMVWAVIKGGCTCCAGQP